MGLDPRELLEPKNVSKSEQIAIDHYKKKPEGRGFYSVAEIMARHQQWDEAIQILSYGLERHPGYSVARVFLSQLLFRRHHFVEAWSNLEASPIPLKGNLSAQLLRLKLAFLLARAPEAMELVKELSQQDFQDTETKVILDQIAVKPFAQVRRDYADFMKIPMHSLPGEALPQAMIGPQKAAESFLKAANEGEQEPSGFRDRVAKGFFASSIQDLFSKPVTSLHPDQSDIDNLTRARLLRRQGLYQRASELYQRLLHEAPGNELLRREYSEICDLRDTQKEIDKRANPEIVDSMEKMRKLDDKLRVLNSLLSQLDNYQNETYYQNSCTRGPWGES